MKGEREIQNRVLADETEIVSIVSGIMRPTQLKG